jgi:hypothetical protein
VHSTKRVAHAVEAAIAVSVREGRITDDQDFLDVPGQTPKVRDRSAVRSTSLRNFDTLPPAELETAILDVVRINYGATDDQVMQSAARAVGFKSISSQLRELLADVIATAIRHGRLTRQSGMLVLGPEAPAV